MLAKQAKTKLKEAKEFVEDILENSGISVEEQSKQIISKFAVLVFSVLPFLKNKKVQEVKTTEKEILLKNKKLEQLTKEKETRKYFHILFCKAY